MFCSSKFSYNNSSLYNDNNKFLFQCLGNRQALLIYIICFIQIRTYVFYLFSPNLYIICFWFWKMVFYCCLSSLSYFNRSNKFDILWHIVYFPVIVFCWKKKIVSPYLFVFIRVSPYSCFTFAGFGYKTYQSIFSYAGCREAKTNWICRCTSQ